jgi:hypothetical protein
MWVYACMLNDDISFIQTHPGRPLQEKKKHTELVMEDSVPSPAQLQLAEARDYIKVAQLSSNTIENFAVFAMNWFQLPEIRLHGCCVYQKKHIIRLAKYSKYHEVIM